jgi:predicted GNAT family acetyltransferase
VPCEHRQIPGVVQVGMRQHYLVEGLPIERRWWLPVATAKARKAVEQTAVQQHLRGTGVDQVFATRDGADTAEEGQCSSVHRCCSALDRHDRHRARRVVQDATADRSEKGGGKGVSVMRSDHQQLLTS